MLLFLLLMIVISREDRERKPAVPELLVAVGNVIAKPSKGDAQIIKQPVTSVASDLHVAGRLSRWGFRLPLVQHAPFKQHRCLLVN